jgi:alpha-N-arabinofuranosidase
MKRIRIACAALAAVTVFTATVCAGCGETSKPPAKPKTDLEYTTTLNPQKKFEISPLIYGDFLEHLPGFLYETVWAELLLDRKFYYAAGTAGLSPWTISGGVSSTEECYSDNGYAAVLSKGGVISQEVELAKTSYVGYFYAGGDGTVEADVGGAKTQIRVSGAFKKYEFTAKSGAQGKRTVSFACTAGEVTLDSLSLMPADHYHGMRRDTLDAMKDMGGTNYRYPGGNFVSGYDWQDGVGDRDKRPCRRNEAWFPETAGGEQADIDRLNGGYQFYGKIEPNDMGTDEYMLMCEYLGSEPYLAVNTGNGTAENAAALVEYCNGAATTAYGRKRAENGRAAPYAVRYWCVGNEMQGDWQIGHTSVAEYVKKHNAVAEAMKAVDGSILLSGCGDNAGFWTEEMFKHCADNLDFISEHMYANLYENTQMAAQHVLAMVNQVEWRIKNHRDLIEKHPAAAHVKIAFDEYAYFWDHIAGMRDALGIAAAMNVFIDNADVTSFANYAPSVFDRTSNTAPSCISVGTNGAALTAVGFVRRAYAREMQKNTAEVYIRQTDRNTSLNYTATVSDDGNTVTVAIVNPSEKSILFDFKGGKSILRAVKIAEDAGRVTETVTENPAYAAVAPQSVSIFTVLV